MRPSVKSQISFALKYSEWDLWIFSQVNLSCLDIKHPLHRLLSSISQFRIQCAIILYCSSAHELFENKSYAIDSTHVRSNTKYAAAAAVAAATAMRKGNMPITNEMVYRYRQTVYISFPCRKKGISSLRMLRCRSFYLSAIKCLLYLDIESNCSRAPIHKLQRTVTAPYTIYVFYISDHIKNDQKLP